jgi:hypothetical protein
VADHLEVKEVLVGERRIVVCRNLREAERDRARRESAQERLEVELGAIDSKRGDAQLRAEGKLLAHPTLSRYLSRRQQRLVVDRANLRAEERLDGKFLLSSTDDSLSAGELALLYKSMLEMERSWRDLKQVLDLRPVYYRKEDRIRAHVTLCFLGLMLVQVVETTVQDSWPNLRRELERMCRGEFSSPTGRVLQRSETTPRQREILSRLEIPSPSWSWKSPPPHAASPVQPSNHTSSGPGTKSLALYALSPFLLSPAVEPGL